MIVDCINQVPKYLYLGDHLMTGLEYLVNVDVNIKPGVYEINENVKAIVEEYKTKENKGLFEAHKKFIDIQFPLIGHEMVQWASLKDVSEVNAYDLNTDRAYFNNPPYHTNILLGNNIFAIFFPADAHNPSLKVGEEPNYVKKLTLKVLIEE